MGSHLFSPVVKLIWGTVSANKCLLWIMEVFHYHGFMGEEYTLLITNRKTSHIQSEFNMFSLLLWIYCWCYIQWMKLQAGLRHPISYQPSAVLRKIIFLYRHYWSFVILLIVRLIISSYSFEFFRLRPPRFVRYSVFAVIIVHIVILCKPEIWIIARMDMPFSHKFLMIPHVSLFEYMNFRWISIMSSNTL